LVTPFSARTALAKESSTTPSTSNSRGIVTSATEAPAVKRQMLSVKNNPPCIFGYCFVAAAADLRHLQKDGPLTQQGRSRQDSVIHVYAACLTFAIAVTIALILHIYLGVRVVFAEGVVGSDHERCTALGQTVLRDGGSSVDAAIAAALCLGVVHPHVSGVGGGGVMLVHDIHGNKTTVINFQGTSPKALTEEMLQNAGLQVGVPGLLRGLHRAHSLYGRASTTVRTLNNRLGKRVCVLVTSSIFFVLSGLFFLDFIIQVPPPPCAGAALISVLNLLEELQLNGNNNTQNQTHHWIFSVDGLAQQLTNPYARYNVLSARSKSMSQADVLRQRINSSHASPHEYPSNVRPELMAGQVVVVGTDELIVSIASSLSALFGSRIITGSGVILNSLILDFSWPNKTPGQRLTNQNNRVQPGKRPQTSLMPTIVVPARHKCGIYVALSCSGVRKTFRILTFQVLISVMNFHKENHESLSLRRLPPECQPNGRLVERKLILAFSDITVSPPLPPPPILIISYFPNSPSSAELPEESPRFEKGCDVTRVKTKSVVQGILRNRDTITAITPLLSDSSLQFS
uniref:Glutathione hydrolase n=1 Tax=Cyclopterus lumpus TaxID=8103 RepID=A0A8C2ZGX0_CYCLU